VIRVRVVEEQVQLSRAQLGRERRLFLGDLLRQLRIAGRELVELDEVASTLLDLVPAPDERSILSRFTRQRAGAARIVPDPRLR
jgi:hypothetical protein